MHKLFWVGAVGLASAVSFAVVACSPSSPTPDASTGPEECPTTLIQAVTVGGDGGEGTNNSCHVQGYKCQVSYSCGGVFIQQAQCTCDVPDGGGPLAFGCILTANGSIVPTDPSTWSVPGDASASFCEPIQGEAGTSQCPTSTATAVGDAGQPLACGAPGEICYYDGVVCPADTVPQKVDTCQCNANVSGDAGLSWMCDIHSCN